MHPGTACWGRTTEVTRMLDPIQNTSRSVQLVFGDSGIGKSTLLQELLHKLEHKNLLPHQLLTSGEIYVGFHKTTPSDDDPLLRSLDNLLRHIYSVGGIPEQARVDWAKLKKSLSLRGVREFLTGIQKSVVESSGLGVFAKAAIAGFGWLEEKALSLEAKVPSSFIPSLSVDVFRDIVAILREVLSEKKLVFIIDNLSAGAEAVSSTVRGFGSADTIQGFLSRDFRTLDQVHFIFSWKVTQKTKAAFDELKDIVEQYNGRVVEVGPIQDKTALADWLGEEFRWFADADSGLKESVIEMTGGLPEVVVAWREARIDKHDEERLNEVAIGVATKRYGDLRRTLVQAQELERRVLYALSQVSHPLPVSSLGALAGQPAEQCVDVLLKWAGRGLVREAVPTDLRIPVAYEYAHEKKRHVVWDCLRGTFPDRGAQQDRCAYSFFLEYFGFPTILDPTTNLYLLDALELLDRSSHVKVSPAQVSMFKKLLALAVADKVISFEVQESWHCPESWPRNLQGIWIECSLGTGYGDSAKVRDALSAWANAHKEAPATKSSAFARLKILPNLVVRARDLGERPIVDKLLEEARFLSDFFGDEELVNEQLAKSIANAIADDVEGERENYVQDRLAELRNLSRTFPESSLIAVQYSSGLDRAILVFSHRNQVASCLGLLQEMRRIYERFPDEQNPALNLSRALTNCLHEMLIERLDLIPTFLDESRFLWKGNSQGTYLPEALMNATVVYDKAGRKEEVSALLVELGALQDAHPESERIGVQFSGALVNQVTTHVQGGELVLAEETLDRVRTLYQKFSENPVFAERLARGLSRIAVGCIRRDRPREADRFVAEIQTLLAKFPTSSAIVENLAGCRLELTETAANRHESAAVWSLVKDIIKLHEDFPENPKVAEYLMLAITNLLGALDKSTTSEVVEELLGSVRSLSDLLPEPKERSRRVIAAIVNAVEVYQQTKDRARVDLLLDEARMHYRSHAKDVVVTESLAKCIVNGAAMYGESDDLTAMELAGKEVRKLRESFPMEITIAIQLESYLFNCVRTFSRLGDSTNVDKLLLESKSLLEPFQHDEALAPLVAASISQASTLYGDRGELEAAYGLGNEMRQLGRRFPANPRVAVALATFLFNTTVEHRKRGEIDKIENLLRELTVLQADFPFDVSIAEQLSKCRFNTCVDYVQTNRFKDADHLVAVQQETQTAFAGCQPIAVFSAHILSWGVTSCILRGALERAGELLDKIEAIYRKYPEELELVERVALNLYNMSLAYSEESEATSEDYFSKLWEILEVYPELKARPPFEQFFQKP